MSITIKYKTLFSIDILHHFFLDKGEEHYESLSANKKIKQLAFYNIHNFLEVVPTVLTQKAIKDHQLIFRQTGTGVLLGCKIDPESNRPLIDIPEQLRFTFLIRLRDQKFFNFTALPLNFRSPQVFYFNNLNKSQRAIANLSEGPPEFSAGESYSAGQIVRNADSSAVFTINKNTATAVNGDLLKDAPAPVFDNSEEYSKGDIVLRNIGGTDVLFEAKIDSPSDTPADLPGNDWKKLHDLPFNYVNSNDLITFKSPIYNYLLESDSINATASLLSLGTSGAEEIKTESISNTRSYQFDWRRIPSGLYQLRVTNDDLPNADPGKVISEERFYLNNQEFNSPVFGIVEIFGERDDSNNYALLNADGSFQASENQFVLRFKNRRTVWRYIFNESQAVAGDEDLEIENTDDKVLITKEIKPLTAKGLISISKGDKKLPNPNSGLIKPESENIFSEVYIYS